MGAPLPPSLLGASGCPLLSPSPNQFLVPASSPLCAITEWQQLHSSTLSFKQLQLTLLFHDIFYQDQERGASEDEAEARSKDEVGVQEQQKQEQEKQERQKEAGEAGQYTKPPSQHSADPMIRIDCYCAQT